jgi:hypothetical protein
MPTYAAGATVERRYPGPDADAARREAEPQVQAFLAAGWLIGGERWDADRQQGAPIGDAIATGSVGYLAGEGGELVITYVAPEPADLPATMPTYTLTNPREERLQSYATIQVVVGVVAIVVFLVIFLSVASSMGGAFDRFGGPGGYGPPVVDGEEFPLEVVTFLP